MLLSFYLSTLLPAPEAELLNYVHQNNEFWTKKFLKYDVQGGW